ncbi:MAG: hypothetical protein ACPG61_17325 [Paracoccaceae bacterium]
MRGPVRWLTGQYSKEATRLRVVQSYDAVFATKGNDTVLEDLRRFCKVYDTTHVPGDSHSTAINEGKRQAYLHLVGMLEVSPEEIVTPKKEIRDARDDERPFDPTE